MGRARFESGLHELSPEAFACADPYEGIATDDAKRILEENAVSDEDVVYLPGADFYSVISFINACLGLPSTKRPKLYIRLIGVLETATQFYMAPLQALAARLTDAKKQGLRIYLSAETPSYADKLGLMTRLITHVTPYPETSEQVSFSQKPDFNIACVGSARLDKGFLSLKEIVSDINALPLSRSITLTTQMLPAVGNANHDQYTGQLYAMAGVRMLNSTLTTDDINALYRNSDVVLLPYAADVYRDRGSAVLMEAASVGRPCVTLAGTAFAVQVQYYGLGKVVDSIKDVAGAIRYYADMPEEDLVFRVTQSRTRFFLDVDASYSSWFLS
jgi:glycosyltransferase involved in cell wall biosynthesis